MHKQKEKEKMKNKNNNIICVNKKAFHDYSIEERYEAGISLQGNEVKSIVDHNVNLQDSFVLIEKGRLVLYNSYVAKYKNGSYNNHEEKRKRFLLMHKKEILRLIQKVSEKGYALIPLSFYYSKTGKIKVELALAKGKHSFDKRDTLRNKQIQNDIKRCLKQV